MNGCREDTWESIGQQDMKSCREDTWESIGQSYLSHMGQWDRMDSRI